jgi:gamma-glutamylaminecyclotransferase
MTSWFRSWVNEKRPEAGSSFMVAASSDSAEFHRRDPQSLIFVYGSLKRGYALHHLLEGQAFLGPVTTCPLYRIFDLGSYPGLVDWPEGLAVQGELYEVDAECLKRLDEAEGVDEGLYARRIIKLQPPFDRVETSAWFWLDKVGGLRDCGTSWP